MNRWELGRVAYDCERGLDLRIRQEFDLNAVPGILEHLGKTFLSPMLDPKNNDFTPAKSFWLVAEDDEGPAICGGMRVDDLGGMDIKSYWGRSLRRGFQQTPTAYSEPFPPGVLEGRICYFGDLFARRGSSVAKRSARNLQLFTAIGHYMAFAEFDCDVVYCFIQDRDVQRGAHVKYGFLDLLPFNYEWETDPYPAGRPEWIGYLTAKKLPQLMAYISGITEG